MSEQQNVSPLHDLDQLASTFLDLADKIAQLTAQQDHIKDQLRDLGVGKHSSPSGIPITIQAPSRFLNTSRAWAMLTPAQQALCMSPDYKKARAQLPPVLLEQCMDPGNGNPVVKVG